MQVNTNNLNKKAYKIAIIALLFAIIGWDLPAQSGTIWVINNTNLAPTFPGDSIGINTRGANNTTYWANDSAIQIFIWGHADTPGDTAEMHLYINNTKVADVSTRPIGVAESTNTTIVATIPQYANYSVTRNNVHHYEWREYQILTGQVSTNLTSVGSGTSAPCTNCINITQLIDNMSLKVNKSGDTMTGTLNMSSNNITHVNMINDNNITFNGSRVSFNDNITFYANATGDHKASNDYLFDYLLQEAHDGLNSNNLVSFQTIDNTGFNFFQGRKARGSINFANKSAVIDAVMDNDVLFRVSGVGWDNTTWSGTASSIDFVANGTFTTSSHPARMDIYTRDDTGAVTLRVSVLKNGSVLLRSLVHSTASGTDYVCATPDGVLITQTAGC